MARAIRCIVSFPGLALSTQRVRYGPQAVGAGDDNVVAGFAARRLALWRCHVTHPEGLGQVANPVEEAGGVGRPIELQAREVVMMHPLVEQRLEEDLGRQHLLAYRRQVVNPDRPALRRRLPGNPVIPVRLQLETSAARSMSLRTI